MITNMRVLHPSRKRLIPGDIFVLQVRDDEYVFGRLIKIERHGGPMEGYHLIYIYNAFSKDKQDIPELDKRNLLVPPIMTNRLSWSRGYFETVAHRDLEEDDVLHPHCFYSYNTNWYCDEYRNELPERIEPCGIFALRSFRTIDDAVSEALGIPLVPD